MSARQGPERLRRELEAAADELFDAIDPDDLAVLVAKYHSRSTLRATAVARAEKVVAATAGSAEQVAPDEYVRLIAATLTLRPNSAGVLTRTDRAVQRFRAYRRFPQLAPRFLLWTSRIDTDDGREIAQLACSLRIIEGISTVRSVGEPELILHMVVPAIVASLDDGANAPTTTDAALVDTMPEETVLVQTTLEVLERGARLAAAYRASGQPCPGVNSGLPVLGNADFLVRMAAYRIAIEERRDGSATWSSSRSSDDVQAAVVELTKFLQRAMTRSAGRWPWRAYDEPDVAVAFGQFAWYLGSAAPDVVESGNRARRVYTVLNHRLQLPEQPVERSLGHAEVPPSGGDGPARVANVEHLVGWLVAALFEGAEQEVRAPLVEWLSGNRRVDWPPNLPLVLRRLRVAAYRLNEVTEEPRKRPAAISPEEYRAMMTRLTGAVDPADIEGCTRADARRVLLDALPPLWTRRWPVSRLVASHLGVLLKPGESEPSGTAVLVATAGSRAPVQAVQRTEAVPPAPCCAESGAIARPAAEREPRKPVDYQELCPHRPWGEIGWVENYHTLGTVAGCSAAAARRQLIERYGGPWLELLLELRMNLSPSDLGPTGERI